MYGRFSCSADSNRIGLGLVTGRYVLPWVVRPYTPRVLWRGKSGRVTVPLGFCSPFFFFVGMKWTFW